MASRLKALSNREPQSATDQLHNKFLTKSIPIEVNPPEIVFKDIEVNQIYEITVEIRNLTKKAVRIRLQKPTNPNFKVEYNMQQEIAPGLAMLAKIKYESKEVKNQNEKVTIVTEDGFVTDLPIRVYKMQSQLLFQPFVNMGFVKVGKSKTDKIVFKNEGKATGIVELSHEHAPLLKIQPNILTIGPQEVAYLNITFKAEEAGLFKGVINLKSESMLLKDTIDIHATSVEYSKFFIDADGNQQTIFDFGNMYVGQYSEIEGFLVNNSPKKLKFRTTFRLGFKVSQEEFTFVQSPSELGHEQNERIMHCEPASGEVPSFSQIPMKFICKSKITYKEQIYTKNYAITPPGEEVNYQQQKLENEFKPETQHEYSVLFDFFEEEPIILQLKGNTSCPLIKVEKTIFQFGDCASHQYRHISFKVTNTNPLNKVELMFPKIPNFYIDPNHVIMDNKSSVDLVAAFEPKNIGKYDTTQALILNKLYQIPLRFFGISSMSGKKEQGKRGPQGITKDFEKRKTFVKELTQDDPQAQRKKAFSLTSEKTFLNKVRNSDLPENKVAELSYQLENRDKYNSVLRDRRTERVNHEKNVTVEKKWSVYTQKLKEMGLTKKYEEKEDEQGLKVAPPIDYEFEVGMINTRLAQPKLPLPQNRESLFVTRHLGPYQPIENPLKDAEKYNPNPNQKPKKIQPEKPHDYNEQRGITSDISSVELQKIEVGPLNIDFGEVFVKSSTPKYFWIRNSTKKSIVARLICDTPEFKKSYQKPQIISSCSEAGFEVVLCRDTIGQVRQSLKYILNEKYVFEMSVIAKVVPVALEVSRLSIKFSFGEDNMEMATYETLKLINKGNSKAMFKFTLTKEKLYVPEVLEGEVEANSTRDIKIKFVAPTPTATKNEYIYTERLLLKILDGVESTIVCTCNMYEPKLALKPPGVIDFGVLCIGQQVTKNLSIKHSTKNTSTAIQVSSEGIEGLSCSDRFLMKPEDSREVEMKYKATKEGESTGQIIIKVRGSKDRIVECKVKCVNPKITFDELLDYQYVIVAGYPGVKNLTLNNTSQVEVPLIIDLRENSINPLNPEGVECIEVKILGEEGNLEVVYPEKVEQEQAAQPSSQQPAGKQPENILNKLELQEDEDIGSDISDEQKEKSIDEKELRRYRLVMKPQKQYTIEVKFYAKEVKEYQFRIPIEIENYGAVIGPEIKCKGIQPQFIFDPQIIDFKRKVITTPDKCFPRYINVTLTNPDTKSIAWSIDDSAIVKEQIFSLEHKKGKLGPGQTFVMKASFNPYEVGTYAATLPLYIEDQEVKQKSKYLDVEIKGIAAFPSINFSKREVILPVVPLNILTTTSFRIFNDGYENINLKSQLLDDVANLGLVISFPEGKNLGITKQKIKVQVAWRFSKPMSFTIKLQFSDDMNRTYVVPISGTTDNCFFTNYAYFLRSEGKFKIDIKDSLIVRELDDDEQNPTRVRKNSAHSMRSSKTNATNKSLLSYLGSSMIKPGILESTIEYLTRYLNSNVLTSKIEEFPRSFIDSDGSQLFEIIAFFTPKGNNFPWRCTIKDKGIKKVEALYNQYSQLIKMLKTEGAHLNHIRPEYLLSFADLNTYLQNILPKEQSKNYSSSLLKVNNSLYSYLSMDSWISLLYQIFRIYLLSRISLKTYRSHIGDTLPNKSGNILDVPKGYLQGSNYMSASEGILCYWIESVVLEVLLQERRITNFDKDFKDGVLIAVLLQKYANVKILRNMKMLCTTDEDYKQNAVQVVKGLEEIGLNSHVQPKDISSPLQREMLLFILHLYNYLPFYTPKQEPIEFKCVLGEEVVRNIELSNPSNKPVFYQAKYDGSPDFTLIGETSFKIQPKQPYKFQVKFASRISTPVIGRVTFINRKENSIAAAALVFDLKSIITGKVSQKIWNINGALYQQVDFPIDIVNRFTSVDVADFTVTVNTQYIYEKKNVKQNISKSLPKEQQVQTIFPKFEIVKLRKNTTTQFQVSYVPTSMHTTKTTVIFSNPTVGEFQHQITATVDTPAPIQQVKPPMNLIVDQVANWEFPVQFKNDAMVRARKITENFKRAGKKTPKDAKRPALPEDNTGPTLFYIDIPPNPFVSSKDTVTLTEKKDPNSKKKEDELSSENKIPLTFACKNPVYEFNTIITLRNAEKTDVRRYRLVITVQPKPLKAILEMNVPARSEITQNLPIVNNTEKDWSIKVNWVPDPLKNGSYFSIPSQYTKDFPVKRKSTGNFPLTFRPKWANKAEAKLSLMNPITMDQFQYEIRGNGEEPLAEQHIEIKCQSKKKFKKEIIVKNPYQERPVTFNVETDLMNCSGSKTLTIASGSKEKYEFTVQPMLCGEYTGSITFSEEEGSQYIWYTVSVITDYPATLKTVNLVTEIRRQLVYELEIENETADVVNYEVIIAGQGLNGQSMFELKPKFKGKYQLKYLPFRVGHTKGSVCFINSLVGEMLYQFDLICEEKPVTRIHGIRSPLGVQKPIPLQLQNPSQNMVVLTIQNSNPEIFETAINTLRLQPGEKKRLEVLYTPSSLDTSEQANIRITSKQIGNWEFNLQGMGLPPVPADPLIVYNSLFQQQTNILKFRNPFRYDITVGVRMTFGLRGEQVFRLILKGKNNAQVVRANDILEIPFSFIPIACHKYECTITVVISEKIQWTYPIIGVTEVNNNETIVHLKTKCREKARQSKQIFLQGIQDVNINNNYSFELDNIPHNARVLVDKFFTVEQHKKNLLHEKDYLEFEFIYKPLKPSKFTFDFVIKKNEGPKWRYKIVLQASQPEPDDVIHFESGLLITSSVSFRLTNWQKNEADFTAKFTSDSGNYENKSANEFSVEPKEGVLAPFGSIGTNFVVSFTPIEYGKEKKGKLCVETIDMYWSYLLKGDLPKYNPPKVTASSIDNRSSLQRSLPKRPNQ